MMIKLTVYDNDPNNNDDDDSNNDNNNNNNNNKYNNDNQSIPLIKDKEFKDASNKS